MAKKSKQRSCGRFDIKCDDCKKKIGQTDSQGVSAQGGKCDNCRK
jgi:hypothetical protein